MTADMTTKPAEAAGEVEDLRYITTTKAMAATAHLLRRRLLDVIHVYGPSTTAQLADRTGQPTRVVADHLAILQDSQWIERMAGPADDDAQPWQISAAAAVWIATNDLPSDPVSKAVVLAALLVTGERHNELIGNWMTARESFTDDWRTSAFASEDWLWLSPAELDELREEVCAVVARWSRRTLTEDNLDRRPVLVMATAVRTEP
jgi:hypothetical protein